MKTPKSVTDHSLFKELNKHPGSENYEIAPIFNKDFEIPELFLDMAANNLNVYGKTNPLKKDNAEHHRSKIDFLGNIIDQGPIHKVLNDGTLWYINEYNNWIINGDTTKHKYLDPFSNKEIEDPYEFKSKETDPEKWLKKFKDLYAKAQYVHLDMSDYYFKIDKKWYYMPAYKMAKANHIKIKEQYPPQRRPGRSYGRIGEPSPCMVP